MQILTQTTHLQDCHSQMPKSLQMLKQHQSGTQPVNLCSDAILEMSHARKHLCLNTKLKVNVVCHEQTKWNSAVCYIIIF